MRELELEDLEEQSVHRLSTVDDALREKKVPNVKDSSRLGSI